jgi:hypothetical protein
MISTLISANSGTHFATWRLQGPRASSLRFPILLVLHDSADLERTRSYVLGVRIGYTGGNAISNVTRPYRHLGHYKACTKMTMALQALDLPREVTIEPLEGL